MVQSVFFESLNWMDVERYLERDDRVVITIGACEQHAYLSLLTDTKIAAAVSQEVCEKEGILMAPPLPFGVSPYFTAYPGTLSLKPATFIAVVDELIKGLLAQGFRRILINNAHGGNSEAIGTITVEFNNTHPKSRVGAFEWWHHPIVMKVVKETGHSPSHGNWSENFPFTRVCPVPEEEKKGPTFKEWPRAASAADYRAALGDGSFGGPYQVSEDMMDQLFAAAVEAMEMELHLLDQVFSSQSKELKT